MTHWFKMFDQGSDVVSADSPRGRRPHDLAQLPDDGLFDANVDCQRTAEPSRAVRRPRPAAAGNPRSEVRGFSDELPKQTAQEIVRNERSWSRDCGQRPICVVCTEDALGQQKGQHCHTRAPKRGRAYLAEPSGSSSHGEPTE